MIRLHARPLPPFLHQCGGPATHRKTVKERQFSDGEGGGEGRTWSLEPNHTTARKLGAPLASIKVFS